ncbi:Membrane insertase OXA1/ALB3/YidC [Cynara cardunculus var. scolymus]|uniref:Membrane insertase OXA1/ALB3/YidC n=1 Tax=Cynara cardunculus var. scolymus TaxID=59895 RepID=A0A118JHC2_CYNCS|nr:Membrane insertase OXA1/ALB3/YidC [Cynara cardunculus var. scolymus]
MAKSLISSPSSFIGTPFPSLNRHGRFSPRTKLISTTVKFSFNGLPPISSFDGVSVDFAAIASRAESLMYTLADAAVAVDSAASASASGDSATSTVQKSGGWFGFISDAMEVVLKVLKDGLSTVHVPYSYGFAIILLTVLVKVATLPLTKQQVESTLAMQNLQPKIKAIQQRYAGNQGLLTEGFFWIPSLGGPTTIAARQSGAGVSWLIPFVDGHPPLGWYDTAAYLVLPVLLVLSQYVSMEIMKPPQTDDPTQKNTLLVFKFLPLMIGYFSLSVPSGFTNNVLSTAQQIWLRKLGGAKPVVSENASGIISAGRAKRSSSQPSESGARFKQLKEEEKKRSSKALPDPDVQVLASTSDSEDETDDNTKSTEVLEEAYASSTAKPVPELSGPRRSKRSKKKRSTQGNTMAP